MVRLKKLTSFIYVTRKHTIFVLVKQHCSMFRKHDMPYIIYTVSMRTFDLKITAIALMVIDHIGLFFFPHIFLLRVIGRLAFPLFAWLIANGAHYSKNMTRYLNRLFMFAMISQIPYYLAFHIVDHNFWSLNILFTLFFGLLAIYGIQKTPDKKKWVVIIVLCTLAAELLRTDYGAMGVLVIVAFYLFFANKKYLVISQIGIFLFFLCVQCVLLWYHATIRETVSDSVIELFGLFSLVFIFFYNKEEGPKVTYFFYVFYCMQYIVVYLLKLVIS